MSPKSIELLIARHLDGGLDQAETAALAQALRDSPSARRLLIQHSRLAAIAVRLDAQGNRAAKRGRRWSGLWPWLAAAACAAAVVSIAAISLAARPRTATPCATLLACAGSVTIARDGGQAPGFAGMALLPGSVITTADTCVVAQGGDGTRLTLAPGTMLEENDPRLLTLRQGMISATVAHQALGSVLVLQTPQARAEVIGTQLALRVIGGLTQLSVQSGLVRLTGQGAALMVAAGHRASVAAGAAPTPDPERSVSTAEPRPPWDLPPVSGTVIAAADGPALERAMAALQSHTTVLLGVGTYHLSRTLSIQHVDDIELRGASWAETTIIGPPTQTGIVCISSHDIRITALTMRDCGSCGIDLDGISGGARLALVGVRLADEQDVFLQGNIGKPGWQGVRVEHCLFEYTSAMQRALAVGFIADTGGGSWSITDSCFRHWLTPSDRPGDVGAAVFLTGGATDTIIARTSFIDCTRAIACGVYLHPEPDVVRARIDDNVFWQPAARSAVDTAIAVWNAQAVDVLHNTILQQGNSGTAIESRYPSTSGLIAGNCCDAAITRRNDGASTIIDNCLEAKPSWFRDANNGDLHLNGGTPAQDAVRTDLPVTVSWDGMVRPSRPPDDAGALRAPR